STAAPVVHLMPALQWAAIGAGLVLAPGWGAAALAAYCAVPAIGAAGTAVAPSDLAGTVAGRWILGPVRWFRTLTGRWAPPPEPDPIESRREWYDQQAALGFDRLFEKRRRECPLCGSLRI